MQTVAASSMLLLLLPLPTSCSPYLCKQIDDVEIEAVFVDGECQLHC
jgi:hypothetical protein